jgi:hypothetical protein
VEKIMSNTNDTSNLDHRELTDTELDAVSGGFMSVEHGTLGEIRRSSPNGRTDVIKAMGNTKWGDTELGLH